MGSPAHARARRRLIEVLTGLGASVSAPTATVCGPRGRCARVTNVIARFGPPTGPAVAVMAHYDTVAASPGAADDGVGVAIVLELAVRYGGRPPSRPLLLVLTDAEELGRLGSIALARDGGLGELSAVVNLEARGTSGPSLLFEVTGATGPPVARFAGVATRPFASSVFEAIYRLLPNDTDLSSVRDLGVPGFNLSFVGRPLDYHTAGDTLDRVSPASAAHQGANAAALVASLLDAPLLGGGEVVWFDLMGLGVVRLPRWTTLPLGGLAITGLGLGLRRAGGGGRQVATGAGLVLLMAALATVVGTAVSTVLHTGLAAPWRSGSGLVAIALIAPGVSVGLGIPRLGPVGDPAIRWAGPLFGAVVGLVLAVALPGAAPSWLVPASLAGVAAVVRPRGSALDAIAPAAAIVLWGPLIGMLYTVVGHPGCAAVTVSAALGTAWLGFAIRDGTVGRGVVLAAAGVGLAAAVAGRMVPAHDADHPPLVNVVLDQGPDGAVRVRLEGEAVTSTAPSTALDLAPPGVTRIPAKELTVRVASARGASTVGIEWEGPAGSVSVDGVSATPIARDGRWGLWVHGVGEDGATFVLGDPSGLSAIVAADESWGLPDPVARPPGTRPFHWGDRTRVRTRLPD